jgi:beta propeller repeat protein
MTNKCILISLAFVFSILISIIASAGQEIRITPDGERGFSPAVYDDKVMWLDRYPYGNIHIRDLSTGKETQITTNEPYPSPVIYNDKVVWKSEGKNIYLYNISTNSKIRLITPDLKSEGVIDSLAIYGDRIVWRDWGVENQDIYLYDLSTSEETRITTNKSTRDPAIYGDRIVWTDVSNGTLENTDIYMYNLSTSEETRITTSRSASSPKIYSDWIVYYNGSDGKYDINVYDLSTKGETKITTNKSLNDQLAIYGDRIVWQDHRSGNGTWENTDIYMYNLSTHKETQITTSETASLPAVYGDRIVWQDYRNDREYRYYYSIYMYDFSAKPTMPFASFSTNMTSRSGNIPLTVSFTYTSNGGTPTSWYWDFGDGTNSKHAKTATHTFTKLGTYNVSLTVTNAAGSNMVKKLDSITVTPPQAPVADFFSPQADQMHESKSSVSVNKTVSFIDNSKGSPTSWIWDFGDGATATTQSPTHAYTKVGGYTVTLIAKNAMGSNTLSKYGYMLVGMGDGTINPAHFSSNVTSGIAPLTVLFHDDGAEEEISREWDFGDGTSSVGAIDNNESTSPYITHKYEKPGEYTVTLTVYGPADNSIITKYNYITVTKNPVSKAPITAFTSNVTSGNAT